MQPLVRPAPRAAGSRPAQPRRRTVAAVVLSASCLFAGSGCVSTMVEGFATALELAPAPTLVLLEGSPAGERAYRLRAEYDDGVVQEGMLAPGSDRLQSVDAAFDAHAPLEPLAQPLAPPRDGPFWTGGPLVDLYANARVIAQVDLGRSRRRTLSRQAISALVRIAFLPMALAVDLATAPIGMAMIMGGPFHGP